MVGSMSGLLPGVLGLLSHPDPDYSVVRTLKARRTPALIAWPYSEPNMVNEP
jgi:hypothetical protein